MQAALVLAAATLVVPVRGLQGQSPLPPLPDSSGWGVHVLTAVTDSQGGLWVGTYGKGIFRLRPGGSAWERIRRDSSGTSISWDFIHAIAFGPRGQVWYGTVGHGWGVSLDGGRTWRNWTFDQLGPEWQYVAPGGIATRGDTTMIGTADGLQITTDDGGRWTAIVDSRGPPARGPADSAEALLGNEYVRRLVADRRGWTVATLHGSQRLRHTVGGWRVERVADPAFPEPALVSFGGRRYRGSGCGLRPASDRSPCLRGSAPAAEPPREPLTAWLRRPIASRDNPRIDQTYRYGSTMGGNFQQHQGVEFNNPDGTPVQAALSGEVVHAGPAERGALTVTLRHDTTIASGGTTYRLYSSYYHNSALRVKPGDRVRTGQVLALVGNTGRATNDHLHLELSASPTDSLAAIVDSTLRFPPYTTNAELWLEPLPGTGIVAGRVLDAAGAPVPGARISGLVKPEPLETPFSFAETYGDRGHTHPLYGEHFAVGDVPAGRYVMGVEIGGRKVLREVTVAPGKLTWVVFQP